MTTESPGGAHGACLLTGLGFIKQLIFIVNGIVGICGFIFHRSIYHKSLAVAISLPLYILSWVLEFPFL